MRYFYSFAFLFPQKRIETGVFSLQFDFYEGNTEENTQMLIGEICKQNNWKTERVRNFAFKKLSEGFINEVANAAGFIPGPGNVGP